MIVKILSRGWEGQRMQNWETGGSQRACDQEGNGRRKDFFKEGL